MKTVAAVMTGKGTGAIATIQLCGDKAERILGEIFRPAGNANFKTGRISLGTIFKDGNTIDEVIVGCEGQNNFAVNCHGNPLIVSDIMKLLGDNGARAISSEEMIALVNTAQGDTIDTEIKIAIGRATTLDGTKLLLRQRVRGLKQAVKNWRKHITELDSVRAQAKGILERSVIAGRLIYGVKIVLAGPPNSGKSTLLNTLAGKQKAIVTDIKGTTRDWVSADCVLGRLYATVIDTAGLDKNLAEKGGEIDQNSQQKTKELLTQADLILLVLDGGDAGDIFSETPQGSNTIIVMNKSDLTTNRNSDNRIAISAKTGKGIDKLIGAVEERLGIKNIDLDSAVCFTQRQNKLIEQIGSANTQTDALSAISELLNGQLRV